MVCSDEIHLLLYPLHFFHLSEIQESCGKCVNELAALSQKTAACTCDTIDNTPGRLIFM